MVVNWIISSSSNKTYVFGFDKTRGALKGQGGRKKGHYLPELRQRGGNLGHQGGNLGQRGGKLGQRGGPPRHFALWETLHIIWLPFPC